MPRILSHLFRILDWLAGQLAEMLQHAPCLTGVGLALTLLPHLGIWRLQARCSWTASIFGIALLVGAALRTIRGKRRSTRCP